MVPRIETERPTFRSAAATCLLIVLALIALTTADQGTSTTVQIDLRAGGVPYTVTGPGECVATDEASIFNAPAAMKSARHNDAARSLNFTLWRLVKGGDMITLDVTLAGKRHQVNTLTVAPAGDKRGSGTATFQARGAGGVFAFDATADTGARITGTVTCASFAKPEENG